VAADFTVREVVRLGRYALPPDEARVGAALATLELEHLANRPVTELSVGQQQRVALGRAAAQLEDGAVLVLDEPTASMDLRHAAAAYRVLQDAAAQRGATVILAMHDLTAVTAVADRAWLMGPPLGAENSSESGPATVRATGAVDEIMRPSELSPVFGLPFEALRVESGRRVLLPAER
jgi:iron complex transport system ATP-binding protein